MRHEGWGIEALIHQFIESLMDCIVGESQWRKRKAGHDARRY